MKTLSTILLTIGLILFDFPFPIPAAEVTPVPVIFDTDIGAGIDDTWALAMILCSPQLDLKLIVTAYDNTVNKAKIAARFLERVGRMDIPIGIGIKLNDNSSLQDEWVKNYDLKRYPGAIHEDGVAAMINTIRASNGPITLIAVGPYTNIHEALRRAPDITQKVRVVTMSGSLNRGYDGTYSPDAEYNIRADIPAAKALYSAGWDLTIAPLDTAGLVSIKGMAYQRLLKEEKELLPLTERQIRRGEIARTPKSPLIIALMENYRIWKKAGRRKADPLVRSSILYDTVAVYLAYDQSLFEMKDLRLRVSNIGMTELSSKGQVAHVAVQWKNQTQFEEQLAQTLINGIVEKKKNQ